MTPTAKHKVIFKKEWYNPLYFILNELLQNSEIRTILIYGGKSSSKTVSVGQIMAKESVVYGASSIAFRKESATIDTTLKKSLNLAIKTTRLGNGFEKLDKLYRSKINESEIPMKGLDTEEKAKGTEGYKYIYLDELNHFTHDEWEQFNMSMRGIEGQKLIASWNPVSETSWVKTDLVDQYVWTDYETKAKLPNPDNFVRISEDGKVILIRTNYLDNYWIVGSPCGTYGYRDQNLIDYYNRLQTKNLHAYLVNVVGEWGKIKTGSEFFTAFDPEKHVDVVEYNNTAPIHVSVDDNVNPYITLTLWQIAGTHIKQVEEILCEHPDNNAPKAARKLVSWLNKKEFANVLFLYGDTTSKKRSTVDENSASFFDKFIQELQAARIKVNNRVGKSNPEVALSGAFMNEIYEDNYGGYSITIGVNCIKSILDYQSVKQDADGSMLKPKVKDKLTGVTYEKEGHISDTKRYFFIQALPDLWKKYKARKSNVPNQIGYFR